jgi:hypothetical protein
VSYRYERYRERPRSAARSWLIFLTVAVWALVLGCLALRFVVRPQLTDYVKRQVAQAIDPQLPAELDPNAALRESLEQLPVSGVVTPGELVVSEEQANSYIDDYRARLQGIDDIRVRFTPGEVQADVTVQGFTGTARVQPVVQDGRIVATNAQLDQPLGSFLSIDELLSALQDRLNSELNAQNRRITDVRIEQGQAIVIVE